MWKPNIHIRDWGGLKFRFVCSLSEAQHKWVSRPSKQNYIRTMTQLANLSPHGTAAHRSLLTSCFRIGVSRSAVCTLTMRASICVRPLSTRPPRSWSDSPSPRPGPTSWAARRRCSGQSSADNVSLIPPCYIYQGRDECAAGVCDQGCDPASLLHLLVSFMRTVCPG